MRKILSGRRFSRLKVGESSPFAGLEGFSSCAMP